MIITLRCLRPNYILQETPSQLKYLLRVKPLLYHASAYQLSNYNNLVILHDKFNALEFDLRETVEPAGGVGVTACKQDEEIASTSW